uniref:Uncharacterized protein n=1 Tax=Plectus sambesii TaxID=2011161 RepID=A0A914WKQ0_9BILA
MNANSSGRTVHRLLAVPEEVVKEFQRRQELQSDQSLNDLLTAERRLASSDNTDDDDLTPEERKTQIASLLERLSAAQQKFASLYKNEGVTAAPGDMEQSNVRVVEATTTTPAESLLEKPKPIAALLQKVKDNIAEEKRALERAPPPPARKRQRITAVADDEIDSSPTTLIPINAQPPPPFIPINYPTTDVNPFITPASINIY